MLLQNRMDRFSLAADVLERCRDDDADRAQAVRVLAQRRQNAAEYLHRHGTDDPSLT